MSWTVAVVALCSTTFTGVAAWGELNLTYRNCENGSRQVSVTSMSPSSASIGTTTHISIAGISHERIASGKMSITTMMGATGGTHFPLLDCTGDVARGGECNMSNSPGFVQDQCDLSVGITKETCAKEMEFLYGHASVTLDGLNFPMAAGSIINIGMKFRLGGRGLVGDFSGRSETMISAVSKSGEKVFCFKIYQGKRDSSGMRALKYKDCGDLQTHGRIVELFPLSLKDGASTRLNIKAILDTSVKSAVGQYHVKTVTSTLPWVTALGNFGDCFGDAGEPIPCHLSLGVPFLPLGTIKYTGMQFPMQKGPMSFNVDLSLNPLIPSWFAYTWTRFMASTPDGETFFCLEVTTTCRNPVECSTNALPSFSHEQNSTDVAVVLV